MEDQSSFIQYERIGADNTQRTIREQISGLPDEIIRNVTWENASRLHQHRV